MWDPQGPAFGRAVKIPVFHAVLSGFDTWLWLPVQPPPNGAPLEAAGGSSSTWVLATTGDPDGVLGFWPWPGPAMAVVGTCGGDSADFLSLPSK